jgi:hypothetical protein
MLGVGEGEIEHADFRDAHRAPNRRDAEEARPAGFMTLPLQRRDAESVASVRPQLDAMYHFGCPSGP